MTTSFTITKPDDLHVHLRDGEILKIVAPHTAAQFGRATVMPNLVPPVSNVAAAENYYLRIKNAAPDFEPIMTLYLTDETDPAEIKKAAESKVVKAVKLYPAGATTNSASGVTDITKIYPALEAAEKHGILFLIHGEVTDNHIDIFDREAVFIDRTLAPLVTKFPNLKIVFEHVTTSQAAEFVTAAGKNVAATITPQHLLFNRNDMLVGGIRPHYYCLPILKREDHRIALVKAALSNNGKFFAGTDSAPHLQHRKETSCGCAGCYNSIAAVQLYAKAFDDEADLSKPETQAKFENFMSKFGADFYGIAYNTAKTTLQKTPSTIPEFIETEEGRLIPFLAGQELEWSIENA